MIKHVVLIPSLYIGLCLVAYPVIAHAQTSVLQTSTEWQQPDNVLVQKSIDVNQERAASQSDTDEIVVKFKAGVSQAAIDAFHTQWGLTVVHKNSSAGFMKIKIPSGKTVNEILNLYRQNLNVLYCEPVYYFKSKSIPNDEKFPYQWNLWNSLMGGINMQKAWDITTGQKNVIVAIVDTGVAYESYYDQTNYFYQCRDLLNTNFVPGWDFVNNDSHPNDDHWHGTFVAGIIAQSTNNTLGTAGVAPGISIMPVKVLDAEGHGSTINIAEGIIWAADHGAKVINLSLGGPEPSLVIEDACSYAYNKGATIVCAAGNRGLPSLVYPAAYDKYCIAVGATRFDETRAYYSDYGANLDFVAPGGDTRVDQNRDGVGDGIVAMTFGPKGYNNWVYLFAHGTSMATAHVSGLAALIISQGIATTPDGIRKVLQDTAEDRGDIGFDPQHGWGLIDAYAALSYKSPTQSQVASQTPAPAAFPAVSTSTATPLESSTTTETAQTTTSINAPTSTPAYDESIPASIMSFSQSFIFPSGSDTPYWSRKCRCYDWQKFLSPQGAYQNADVVFVGRILKTKSYLHDWPLRTDADWKWYQKRYIFQVVKNYKQVNSATIRTYHKGRCIKGSEEVVSGQLRSGAPGTCFFLELCDYPFDAAGTYLIYAKYNGKFLITDKCSRILPIAEANADLAVLEALPK